MAKKYRVTSRSPVFGYSQGAEFTASIDPEQEQRLLSRGAVERVRKEKPRAGDGEKPNPADRRQS